MKKTIVIICLFMSIVCHAQEERKFALMMNMAQLPYRCYELNGLVGATDRKFQFLIAVNVTSGNINGKSKRNTNGFDKAFMIKVADKIQGWGVGGQVRLKLMDAGRKRKGNDHLYVGFGCNYYDYKITFYENEYTEDQPPFYHYTVVKHVENFSRINPHTQFIFDYTPGIFFLEAGVGLGYNRSFIPETIERYRDLQLNLMDYGFTGFSPSVSLRLGFWLY